MSFDIRKAIEERNRDFDEKIEDGPNLYKLFSKTAEDILNNIDKLPEGERKKQLDSYQMMVMIASQLSHLIQYNLKMTRRNSNRIDLLMHYSTGDEKEEVENLKPIKAEEEEKYKNTMKWMTRHLEDKAKNLEGENQ